MKRLVLIALCFNASSAFAILPLVWGFETDRSVAAQKRGEAIERIQQLRDEYLEERSVPRRDMLVALQSLFKICRLESELYKTPGSPKKIPAAALPFWREATKLATSYDYYFTCDPVQVLALQPAPWEPVVWENLRTDINRQLKQSAPYFTPNWVIILRSIAARPSPEINQVPDDIQAAIRDFAFAAWSRKGLPRETDTDIWSSVAMLADKLASESRSLEERMDRHYEWATNRNRELVERSASMAKHGFYATPQFSSLIDNKSVMARDATRALALALEAVAPGSLTDERPQANSMFYPEDLESILRARESSSCVSNL